MNFAQVCLKFKLTLKKHICEQAFKKNLSEKVASRDDKNSE